MEEPPGQTVVAVTGDDTITGSANMGPNRPGRGAHIATASFIVDPDRQGQGIGRALGEYVLSWARAERFHGIQFNAVVEANHPAVHLWQSLGFGIIGTVPEAFEAEEFNVVTPVARTNSWRWASREVHSSTRTPPVTSQGPWS